MDKHIIQQFEENREAIKASIEERYENEGNYIEYKDLVEVLVSYIDGMDEHRISQIDYGDYQGCLVYIIAEEGYQPANYWAIRVWYGSCSACDSLHNALYSSKDTIGDLMALILHMAQGAKQIISCHEEEDE